jgi:hypothetical protein
MQRLSRLVAATSVAALVCLPVSAALAQSAPNTGAAATTAAPSTTAAETAPAGEKGKAAPKKKKPARMTRQQEIDRSIDQGTVPARYRSSVPKEYQQYIPFDKR